MTAIATLHAGFYSGLLIRRYVGFTKNIQLPKGGRLFMDDEVPDGKRARVFDVNKHSFNPLKGINYKKARELADLLYTIAPQGAKAADRGGQHARGGKDAENRKRSSRAWGVATR